MALIEIHDPATGTRPMRRDDLPRHDPDFTDGGEFDGPVSLSGAYRYAYVFNRHDSNPTRVTIHGKRGPRSFILAAGGENEWRGNISRVEIESGPSIVEVGE